MKKQIISLIILTALANLTTHAMDRMIHNKKSYNEHIIHKYPRPKKQKTREETIQEIINDNSDKNALVLGIIIESILREQAKLQTLNEYIIVQ